MDWIKRNLREVIIFLLMCAASGALISMIVVDAEKLSKKLKDYDAQIIELRQEVALVRKELQSSRERARTP